MSDDVEFNNLDNGFITILIIQQITKYLYIVQI